MLLDLWFSISLLLEILYPVLLIHSFCSVLYFSSDIPGKQRLYLRKCSTGLDILFCSAIVIFVLCFHSFFTLHCSLRNFYLHILKILESFPIHALSPCWVFFISAQVFLIFHIFLYLLKSFYPFPSITQQLLRFKLSIHVLITKSYLL